MLISSKRHTIADLALWSELEEADAVYGERMMQGDKTRRAIEEMRQFADAGPCYVACSWGKDSVVVAHLLHLSGLSLPLVNIAQHGPQYDHYCPVVRDAFLSRFDVDYREIVVEVSDAAQTNKKRAPSLEEGIRQAHQMTGTDRYIGGIRASEGGGRKRRCARGLSFGRGCAPIGWWSPEDVFGYLAANDLPIHPAYAMTGGGMYDRNRIRVSIIGGAKGRGGLRDPWEREYYGDILRRLEAAR